jgi:hypothetical protein
MEYLYSLDSSVGILLSLRRKNLVSVPGSGDFLSSPHCPDLFQGILRLLSNVYRG